MSAAPLPLKQANKRGTARLAAVQALYQMDVAQTPINEVIAAFETFWMGKEVEGEEYLPADSTYFRNIVKGTLEHQLRIDQSVDALLADGWPLKRVEAVLRAVLRAGAYELYQRPDVPARTIITEYMDVASAFLDNEEVAMVNAVLDRIAKQTRASEFNPAAG